MSVDALPDTFWLTRDRLGGDLSAKVELWSVLPQRLRCEDGDVIWLAPDALLDGTELTCLGDLTVAEARLRFGPGIPETDRECTRVGSEPPEATGVS